MFSGDHRYHGFQILQSDRELESDLIGNGYLADPAVIRIRTLERPPGPFHTPVGERTVVFRIDRTHRTVDGIHQTLQEFFGDIDPDLVDFSGLRHIQL